MPPSATFSKLFLIINTVNFGNTYEVRCNKTYAGYSHHSLYIENNSFGICNCAIYELGLGLASHFLVARSTESLRVPGRLVFIPGGQARDQRVDQGDRNEAGLRETQNIDG